MQRSLSSEKERQTKQLKLNPNFFAPIFSLALLRERDPKHHTRDCLTISKQHIERKHLQDDNERKGMADRAVSVYRKRRMAEADCWFGCSISAKRLHRDSFVAPKVYTERRRGEKFRGSTRSLFVAGVSKEDTCHGHQV